MQARQILVDFRIPHHAKPSEWFGFHSVLLIAIVVFALWVFRKNRIFPVLLTGSVITALLTLLQIITSSDFLALLFPWRISVWLVPISSCLLIAKAVELYINKPGRKSFI